MNLLESVWLLSFAVLAIEDYYHYSVSLYVLIIFFLLSVILLSPMMWICVFLLMLLFNLLIKIHTADLLVFCLCLCVLCMQNYFLGIWFMIIAGLFGMMWHILLRCEIIPFIACLFISYIIIRFLCFVNFYNLL